MVLKIKPLSINESHYGKHIKTTAYRLFEKQLQKILPSSITIPKGKLQAYYRFGVSSKNCDYDNFIKNTQDILQKKYGFNDRMIYKATIEKTDVSKGDEFIEFSITPIDNQDGMC